MTRSTRKRWGPLRSLLFLSPIFVCAPWLAIRDLHALPEPVEDAFDPTTGRAQLSEGRILAHARHLSEVIGYRTVGTREHALADEWMLFQAEQICRMCEEANQRRQQLPLLECEVWHQVGSGSHRFDMMGEPVYKTYMNLTNIVLRVSRRSDADPGGTTVGKKKNAVLLNAHVDSTLPSPGAADDGLPIGVMLECARVLVMDPEWVPVRPIVFLFNNAEESLQDGSHLFSTQNHIRDTIGAVINLEAAGTTGRELLFQATSKEMIDAYSHVPRPFGTVFANEIFSSGILLSDTDFRQFQQYLNVPGLDMAIIGNSYYYHTRKDVVDNIQPGVAQNMGFNTLSILKYLSTSPDSLPSYIEINGDNNNTTTRQLSPPRTVFFSYFRMFFMFSFSTAGWIYAALVALSGWVANTTLRKILLSVSNKDSSSAYKTSTPLRSFFCAASFHFAGLVGSLVAANTTALILGHVLGRAMGWFADWRAAAAVFGVAAVFGILLSQLLLLQVFASRQASSMVPPWHHSLMTERTVVACLVFLQALTALVMQVFFSLGSAILFGLTSVSILISLLLDPAVSRVERWVVGLWCGLIDDAQEPEDEGMFRKGNGNEKDETKNGIEREVEGERPLALTTYALGQVVPLISGTMIVKTILEVFVPLTGRTGSSCPADALLATIVSSILSLVALPLLIPFVHRFQNYAENDCDSVADDTHKCHPTKYHAGSQALRRGVARVGILAVVLIAWVAQREPFDATHPRRVFFVHSENISSNERHLHVAIADAAPGFDLFVRDMAEVFVPTVQSNGSQKVGSGTENINGIYPVEMTKFNSDWDVIYPYSNFLTPYKMTLEATPDYHWAKEGSTFEVVAVESEIRYLEVGDGEIGSKSRSSVNTRTRRVKIEVRHPGLIWTVIAFDAHVLEWNLDERPPNEYTRHRVKEASFYGVDVWTLDMVIALPPEKLQEVGEGDKIDTPTNTNKDRVIQSDGNEVVDKLLINFVGIQEKGMWPGKMAEMKKNGGGGAMVLFEKIDEWLEEYKGGAVDAMMLGCVAGAVSV